MSWRVCYTPVARKDLERLYAFLLEHDMGAARRALTAIVKGTELLSLQPPQARPGQSLAA